MSDIETWQPVHGFPIYEVSSLGAVRSVPRVTRHGQHRKGKILSQRVDGYGYWSVTLYVEGRKPRPYRVHLLVARAFLGPRPAGADTRHGPGGRLDNRVSNLCYGTRAENEQDKKRDGTFRHGWDTGGSSGERNNNARLTEEAVRRIRERYVAGGITQTELAREHNVTQTAIYNIVRYKTWKHVK